MTIIDFTYQFGGNGIGANETVATLTFETTGDGYTNPLAINEMCGNITIFNPMRDAIPKQDGKKEEARAVKSVTIIGGTEDGTVSNDVALDYSIDADSQVLKIVVSNPAKN